jgi:ABC-type sugar transport system substrate-binding protein
MDNHSVTARSRRWRLITWLCAVVLGAVALSACGKSSSTGSSSASASAPAGGSSTASSSTAAAAASTGCGTVPTVPFHDASGVIATLPAQYKTAFNGYASTIYKSAWAHFKPKHAAPYTIGISITQPINSFQGQLATQLEKQLHAVKGVGKVTLLTAPPTGLTTQIQQTHQLIQQKVDLIVSEPLVPPAFAGIAAAAGKVGNPFISLVNSTPTPFSINLAPNSVEDALNSGAYLAKLINESGTVIGVHGIQSTGVDQQEFAGWKKAFAACPKITFDPSLVGQFQVPVAKQATLTYLASHPQPVAGAVQTAGMTAGITQAFTQTGRPQPAHVNVDPSEGDLAYWSAHKSSFKAIAFTVPAQDVARATAYTVTHLLSGQGPKISELSQPSPTITASNLSQWATPGASPTNPTAVEGPGNQWLPSSYLAPLFNK